MSDRPLFQNADEQEAAYAPQQLPDGSSNEARSDVDDRDHGTDTTNAEVGVPAAGAGLLGMTGGGAASGVVGGSPAATGPSVGAAEPEDETAGDDDRRV